MKKIDNFQKILGNKKLELADMPEFYRESKNLKFFLRNIAIPTLIKVVGI